MSPHKNILDKILNGKQKIDALSGLIDSLQKDNIAIEIIHDPDEDIAYFDCEDTQYEKPKDIKVVFNTTYTPYEISIAAHHEKTHVDQKQTLTKAFKREQDYSITSQIGYRLLAEAHAFSSQCEFALNHGNKFIDAIYQYNTISHNEINYSVDSYFFNHYLNSMRNKKFYIPKGTEEAKNTIKNFRENNSETSYKKTLLKGRENIFKGFFDLCENNSRGLFTSSTENIEDYICDGLEIIEDYIKGGIFLTNEEMPLDLAVSTLMTDGKPFVSKEFIQNTLGIKSLSDIANAYISTSKRRKEFQERIEDLSNQETLIDWQQRKQFSL